MLTDTQTKILEILKTGSFSSIQLSMKLYLPRTTVYDNLVMLIRKGYVKRVQAERRSIRGRKPMVYAIDDGLDKVVM